MNRNPQLLIGACVFLAACVSAGALGVRSINQYRMRDSSVPADWPKYVNTLYSFQFRYPPGWDIRTSSGFDTPWGVQLFAPTASSWPITIFANLGYSSPSEAATVWSNTRSEYRGSMQFKIGQISGYKIAEAKEVTYLHYYFKGSHTPTLDLIAPLFMPDRIVAQQKLVEQILSSFYFK